MFQEVGYYQSWWLLRPLPSNFPAKLRRQDAGGTVINFPLKVIASRVHVQTALKFTTRSATAYDTDLLPSPIPIKPPKAAVKVVSLSATSFTVLVTNENEFATNNLFWVLLPYGDSAPSVYFLLVPMLDSDTPIAKSNPSGEYISPSDGVTHGVKEVVISTGISSGTSYKFHAFVRTGGYPSGVGSSTTITTP